MSTDYTVSIADWPAQHALLRHIRETVFIVEQSVPRDIEWDGRDDESTHFLVNLADEVVGCGRLLPEGKIGRMAVLPQHRGKGAGAALLAGMVEAGQAQGHAKLYLHAQQHAEGFYAAAGFERVGDAFEEAGIAHIVMELHAETDLELAKGRVAYPFPFAEHAVSLAAHARRHLCIQSPVLDPEVFDTRDMADAVSRLARHSRYARIRILIQDSRPLIKRGHQLLSLARRLDSSLEIRKLGRHPELTEDTLVIADADGLLWRPADADREAIFRPDDRALAGQKLEAFDLLWERARPDPELRQLRL